MVFSREYIVNYVRFFMAKNQYHSLLDVVFKDLNSSRNGLSSAEIKSRIQKYGTNEVKQFNTVSPIMIFLRQFNNPLIIILIFVCVFSFFVNELLDATVILVMLLINAFLGYFQEVKAEKSLEKLKNLVVIKSKVVRDGKVEMIDSKDIVPGDVVILNMGDIVPADIRIIESKNLSVNESALTGESIPVEKKESDSQVESDLPQDIDNGLFLGTSIATGYAKGIVVYTNNQTFLAKTISFRDSKNLETNFEKNLKDFSNLLLKFVVVLVVCVFIVNAFLDRGVIESFLLGVTLALGITPEVLPIIVTMAISSAAHNLAKKKVIVRRLSSLEDFGNVDILCSDKTGTITTGELNLVEVEGDDRILEYALLCNAFNPQTEYKLFQNPLDKAIWENVKSKSLFKKISSYKLLDVEDFNFDTRVMSVTVEDLKDNKIRIIKGSFESIIDKDESLTKEKKEKITEKIKALEEKGYRTISIGCGSSKSKTLNYLGYLTFEDPPRPNMQKDFDKLNKLNVALKIITGDSPVVTKEVCSKVGFSIIEDRIILGEEIEKMTDKEFIEIVRKYNVFARVSPEQKFKIIETLKKNGHVVAYMGDGINDIGALNVADVGLAVNSATDVAKDSSDIILLDKSLSSIETGIIEGRKAFTNTIKFILNTMSSSFGNVITISFASAFLPFIPLLPVQVLLLDSLSDLQHLTISTDNVDAEFFTRPRNWDMKVFIKFIIFWGLISTVFDFILIFILLAIHDSPEAFRTLWFIESSVTEILATFAVRTTRSIFKSIPSRSLILMSIFTVIVSVLIPFTELGRALFGFSIVNVSQIGIIIAVVIFYLAVLEVAKKFFYKHIAQIV